MATNYNPRTVTDGLVLCLDAGNTKSYPGTGTTWTDISRNGNDGSLINTPGYTSDNGGGITFNGTDERGTFTTPITSTSNQTYEVWTNAIASPSANDGFAYILHNNSADSTVGNSYLHIGIEPTQQYVAAFNGRYTVIDSGVTASNSNIVQIVLTWDGATQKMYVNSVLKDSEVLTETPQNLSTTTSFGDYRDLSYRPIQGNIYSIKIYNKALSAAEVEQNFNALRGRFGI